MAHGSTTTLSERGAYWLEHVQQWQSSGLNQVVYCRERGLSATAFRWWRRKFLREDRLVASEDDAADRCRPGFVEVVDSMSSAPGASGVYEIVLSNQRCLRLWGCFEADAVRTLVSVLEGPC